MNGTDLITKERQEQVVKHHRTTLQDVEYNDSGQLINAARALLYPEDKTIINAEIHAARPKEGNHGMGWDFYIFSKMMRKPYKERLVIAGALIAAEIDRIQAVEAMQD